MLNKPFLIIFSVIALCTMLTSIVLMNDAARSSRIEALISEAEHGDIEAQTQLGRAYYEGIGVKRDFANAFKWLSLAAKKGNAVAESYLGNLYSKGYGVRRDQKEAIRLYQLAAEQGEENAMRKLSALYSTAKSETKDKNEAKKWNDKLIERHSEEIVMALNIIGLSGLILVAVFALSLHALKHNMIPQPTKLVVLFYVHVVGTLLVLNSLNTYAFTLFFPWCSHSFLATSCYDAATHLDHKFIAGLGDLQMVNLLMRFMAIFGFVLDVLAVQYIVFCWKKLTKAMT